MEVAPHVDARGNRVADGGEVRTRVVDAAGVRHAAGRVRCIVDCASVLGDVDRWQRIAVAVLEVDQKRGEGLGNDRPVEVGARISVDLHERKREARIELVPVDECAGLFARRGHLDRVVVVDAVPVDRHRNLGEVVGKPLREQRLHCLWVATEQDRIREQPVGEGVVQSRSLQVLGALTRRPRRTVIVCDADVGRTGRSKCGDRLAVAEQQVVSRRERPEAELQTGRLDARAIAEHGENDWLVDGDPARDTVGEVLADEAGVVREPVGRVPIQPSPALLEWERGIPVEERRARRDPGLEQAVDEAVIEVEASGVGRTLAGGLDARPRE